MKKMLNLNFITVAVLILGIRNTYTKRMQREQEK